METKTVIKKELTEKENDLIELIRKEIPFGSFKVYTRHGQPVRFEEGIRGREFGEKNG